nr:hypothetical protein [uncultured Campylobacter sp.]
MKNLLLGAVAVWAFCGCAGLKPSADKGVALIDVPEENWTRYKDTDGTLKEVAFFTAFFSERFRASFKNGEKIGFTLTKQEGKKLPVMLGDMYKAEDGAFTVAGLDARGREWSGDEKLRRSRRIKIYEFKEGAVNVTDYEAEGGVCEAFYAGKKISATSVESRDGEDARQIFAVRTLGEISLEGVKIFSSQENSLPQKRLSLYEKGSHGAQANGATLTKQAQTLKNIVCAGFEKN